MDFDLPIPILRIFEEEKAKEFYIDFLEFKIDWEHRYEPDMPLYMQISKANCQIHLTEHFGDCAPGASIRIRTKNLVDYQRLLASKRYKNARPDIVTQPWESEEMSVTDPFHNKLTFFQN